MIHKSAMASKKIFVWQTYFHITVRLLDCRSWTSNDFSLVISHFFIKTIVSSLSYGSKNRSILCKHRLCTLHKYWHTQPVKMNSLNLLKYSTWNLHFKWMFKSSVTTIYMLVIYTPFLSINFGIYNNILLIICKSI